MLFSFLQLTLFINNDRYRDNGKAGYLLKPDYLCDPAKPFNVNTGPFDPSERMNLKIEITSASQLPKPGGSAKGEVIDPYISVELYGLSKDHKKCRTKTIDNNGFNPIFNETFMFNVTMKR